MIIYDENAIINLNNLQYAIKYDEGGCYLKIQIGDQISHISYNGSAQRDRMFNMIREQLTSKDINPFYGSVDVKGNWYPNLNLKLTAHEQYKINEQNGHIDETGKVVKHDPPTFIDGADIFPGLKYSSIEKAHKL